MYCSLGPSLPIQPWPTPSWNCLPSHGRLPNIVPGPLPSFVTGPLPSNTASGSVSTPGPSAHLPGDITNSVFNNNYDRVDIDCENSSEDSMDENNNVKTDDNDPNTKVSEDRLFGFRSLFRALYEIFPDRFTIKDSVIPYYRARHSLDKKSSDSIPMLKISPQLKGSWFDPPQSGTP